MIVKALSLSLSRFLAGFWINKLQGSKGPKLKHLPVKALSLSLSRFCLKVKPFHFHFHKTPKGESRRLEVLLLLTRCHLSRHFRPPFQAFRGGKGEVPVGLVV